MMAYPIPDKQATLAALDDASARLLDLLAQVPDSSAPALGVWSIAELTNHISQGFELYSRVARGEGSPMLDQRESQEFWRQAVKEDAERDLGALADRIVVGLKDFKNEIDRRAWTDEVPWHGGLPSPVSSLAAGLLNECEVHGLDVATALGRSWKINPAHARLVIEGHLPWLPYFVDPEVARNERLAVDVRVRGGSRFQLVIGDGALKVLVGHAGVDVHVSVDPVAFLLVGYGRLSQARAAGSGKMLAWGRRPWKALRLGSLFVAV